MRMRRRRRGLHIVNVVNVVHVVNLALSVSFLRRRRVHMEWRIHSF